MQEQVSRLWRRVLLVVGRGRIGPVDDAGQVQRLQVQMGADETIDGLPRLAEYGFQSAPPAGSDAVVLFLAGERSNGVVIACGIQMYRLRGLKSGEVVISDDKNQFIYLSADGIKVNGGGMPLQIFNTPHTTINSPTVTINGDLNVDGNVTSGGNVQASGDVSDQAGAKTMATMRFEYNVHKHGSSSTPNPTM